MITKLNIDALVASKFGLYKSNEHFKHFNLTQMHSTIRDEIESLCDLADQRVCIKRCNHFNIKGTRPDDYRERIIYLDEDLFFLAGIRFQGPDVTKSFVSVHANFSEFTETQIFKIAELLKKEFEIFSPKSFNVTYPQGQGISTHDFQIDRYTVVGVIKELVQLELVPITDELELIPLTEMNFYDEYVKEYALLYTKSPFLRSEVKTESLESLNDSAKDGLLFKVQINGKCAGVIAGYIEDYYGQKEVCILEELLFESFRGKGLGVYLQKAFAIKMLDRFNLLWGHISDLNPSSLKTALKNGRKITEIEYIFSLDNF
ncbi:MAG: hypothetical protein PHY93_20165, partial [Bacteriovorax sp.]|nr:hypothetical protein [Bacteriovorax sp.]